MAALVCLLAGSSVFAAGPYTIHRSDVPASARAYAPLFQAAASPFDDAPGLLQDGRGYFYVVTDADGGAVPISVHKNSALQTVRVAFDDESSFSAPASGPGSSVTVEPGAIPADGLTAATVAVVPRDSSGQPLGTGLLVVLDAAPLWPGSPSGGVVDEGDGRYTAQVVSSIPGTGTVWVQVEGIALSETPSLTYLDTTGSTGTMLDQAILKLQALTDAGGDFDALLDLVDPGTAIKVENSLNHALDAVASLPSPDPGDHEHGLNPSLKESILKLEQARRKADAQAAAAIDALIAELVDVARLVGLFYGGEAVASCGPCTEGSPVVVCDIHQTIAAAENSVQASDFDEAVRLFAQAVREGIVAEQQCP